MYSNNKRQILIEQVSQQIRLAEQESLKLATLLDRAELNIQQLIIFAQDLLEESKANLQIYNKYSNRLNNILNDQQQVNQQSKQQFILSTTEEMEQFNEKNLINENLSQISFVSNNLSQESLNDLLSQEQELKIIKDIFIIKKDIKGLQHTFIEILNLKYSIKSHLQSEIQKVKLLYDQLLKNERRIRRLLEFERDQQQIIKQKQIELQLE